MASEDRTHGPPHEGDGPPDSELPAQPPQLPPESDDDLFGPMEPVFVPPTVPQEAPQEWPPAPQEADPAEPVRAEPDRAEPDRTVPAEPDAAEPAQPDPTEPAEPDPAEPDRAEPDHPVEAPEAADSEPAQPPVVPETPVTDAARDALQVHGALAVLPAEAGESWRRLGWLARPRLSNGTLLAALMTLAIGFALVAQVQATQDVGLEDLRETDLVALLDDVTARADSLESELRQLEEDRRVLLEGGGAEAAAAAQARLESLQILSGAVAVQGPGITMTVSTPEGDFTPTMMIDVIQELRDAGAEAIQIGPSRVVASTWIGTEGGEVTVDGAVVPAPFRIVAIGDAHTLAGAMAIPGGFSDSVRGIGGDVAVVEGESLVIDALHQPSEPAYAQPVPSE